MFAVVFFLGYVQNINGLIIAEVCLKLGAGRQFSNQVIDPAVGVHLFVKIGDYIDRGSVCMVLHHNETNLNRLFLTLLQNSIELTDKIVTPENIILGVIDCNSL